MDTLGRMQLNEYGVPQAATCARNGPKLPRVARHLSVANDFSDMQTDSDIETIISSYASDRRAYDIPNYRREDLGSVVRYTPLTAGADGIVSFAKIPEADLDRAIKAQCEYFKERNQGFEWKVYDFDEPSALLSRLIGFGFEQGETEVLMVCDLGDAALTKRREIDGIEIREVGARHDLEAIVQIQEAVWNREFPWLLDQLMSATDRTAYFCAFDQDIPIAAGWIEYPQGSHFAEIHGGSVRLEYRGRRIYSELFRARMEHAKTKGLAYIAVDAAPMSRPILEKKGFVKLCSTYPLRMKKSTSRGCP